jgi:hypothetical protein
MRGIENIFPGGQPFNTSLQYPINLPIDVYGGCDRTQALILWAPSASHEELNCEEVRRYE